MNDKYPKLSSRLVIGAVAGFVGTMAMTAAMNRMHRRLPAKERYPLTPREIVDSGSKQLSLPLPEEAAKDVTTMAHFAYGAASGALLGATNVMIGPIPGGLAGITIWLGSYMGWIPAANILTLPSDHPARRNLLMLTAHVVWGAATAQAMRELVLARETILGPGPDKDAPPEGRRD